MPYKVLTLDGGGAWALIEVHALIKMFGSATTGHEVLRHFDLVAANSGGSLVLAGLVENLPLDQILQYFKDDQKRGSFFSPTQDFGDAVVERVLKFGPRYSAMAKLPAIQRLLPRTGDEPLANAADAIMGPGGKTVHLLIVGFDYDTNRAVFFRSAPASGPGWGDGEPASVTLAGAVHASTNAPINYFDAPAVLPFSTDRFWDGGVSGCNNPAVVAVVEALVLKQVPTEIHLLSLGTASVLLPLADVGAPASPFEAAREQSSLLHDLKKIAGAVLDDPPDAATFIAHAMTGGSDGLPAPTISRIVRMSPLIAPVRDPDGGLTAPAGWPAAQFQHLCGIDLDAMQPLDITYIEDYCLAWLDDAAPNQPIRGGGTTFDPWRPEIGYAKFSEALAAWNALKTIGAVPMV